MHEHTCFFSILLIAMSHITIFVHGDAVLEVRMMSYRNPHGLDALGATCDPQYRNESMSCDTVFYFCFDEATGDATSGDCFFGNATTRQFLDRNNVEFTNDMNGVTNPLKIDINVWPGHLRFKLQVSDNDGVKFDLIDRMTVLWNITAARDVDHSTWSDAQDIYGIRESYGINSTLLSVKYRVYCKENFYTTSCDRHCVASNDMKRHTFCDPDTGAEVCYPGWGGPNCDTPSIECIGNKCTNGSTCLAGNHTYTCLCPATFTGQFCEEIMDGDVYPATPNRTDPGDNDFSDGSQPSSSAPLAVVVVAAILMYVN